jgi:hypothetical protein
MARGWNGEMLLATRSKNSLGKVKETQKEATCYPNYHRKPGA